VDLLPLEVDTRHLQGGDFPNSQAAECADQEHELKRLRGCIDDSRGGVRVEKENLGLRFFVGGELDIFPPDLGERDSPTFGPYSESK